MEKNNVVGVKNNLTAEGKIYQAYHSLKNPNKQTDKQNKLISAEEDLKSAIRIAATEIFAENNQDSTPKQIVELFTNNSVNKDVVKDNAQNVYDKLKEDSHIKDILANAKNKNIGSEAFFDNLFIERKEEALERMGFFNKTHTTQDPLNAGSEINVKVQIGDEIFAKNLTNYVTSEKNNDLRKAELKGKKQTVDRINFVSTHATIFDERDTQGKIVENAVNKEVKKIINDFEKIPTTDKIDLLLNRNNVNESISKATEHTRNALQTKLTGWINDNAIQLQIQSNFNQHVNRNDLDKSTAAADDELTINYFEELSQQKSRYLKHRK